MKTGPQPFIRSLFLTTVNDTSYNSFRHGFKLLRKTHGPVLNFFLLSYLQVLSRIQNCPL